MWSLRLEVSTGNCLSRRGGLFDKSPRRFFVCSVFRVAKFHVPKNCFFFVLPAFGRMHAPRTVNVHIACCLSCWGSVCVLCMRGFESCWSRSCRKRWLLTVDRSVDKRCRKIAVCVPNYLHVTCCMPAQRVRTNTSLHSFYAFFFFSYCCILTRLEFCVL